MMKEKPVTLKEASQLLGIDRETLAGMLKVEKFPFGRYYRAEGGEKGFFYINRKRLEDYLSGADMHPICPYADQHRAI
jgi:hypothetical protein